MKLRIAVSYDDLCFDFPWNEWDTGARIVSFCNRHRNYEDVEDYYVWGKDGFRPNIGLNSKLRHNTAFVLDLYRHGSSCWSFYGEGTQCRFDTSRNDGLLLLDNNTDIPADRRIEFAREFLEMYNNWVNGNIYYFSIDIIDESCEDHIDSCGGIIGHDALTQEVNRAIEIFSNEKYCFGESDIEICGDAGFSIFDFKIPCVA